MTYRVDVIVAVEITAKDWDAAEAKVEALTERVRSRSLGRAVELLHVQVGELSES